MARWDRITNRGNVQDRRGISPAGVGGISLSGVLLYLLVSYLSNGQVQIPVNELQNIAVEQQSNVESAEFAGEDSYEVFASTVLGSNNATWEDTLSKANADYEEPTLVLFRTATNTACGYASSEVGPFYCPLDETIYLDETFFDELTNRFGARGGDVAQAYVIAHEVAHHVQNQMGIMQKVNEESNENPSQSNELSIKLELQADCLAGLWAYSIKDLGVIEQGEIAEAMDAASAVGDDRIQKSTTGRINPESWTHGSSEQRVQWFNEGYTKGQLGACNTFNN